MSQIKKVFESRFSQGKLIEADYSQLEIYALAFLANDAQLKEDLLKGRDLHCVSGSLLAGMDYETFYKDYKMGDPRIIGLRKLAKQLSFQLQYGAGASSMAKKNGITTHTAKDFIAKYYKRYTGVKEYHKTLMATVKLCREPTVRIAIPNSA